MRIKPILYSTLLCLAALPLLSAAPPADRGQGKNDRLVEDADAAKEKRSWADRMLGRERDKATEDEAEDEAERQREAAEERAETARERKEAAEEKAGKPGWVERLFGGGADEDEADETVDEPAAEARGKGGDKAKAAQKKFTTEERAVLEDWQRGEAGWKKSGRKLPPGLQKKVDRGGELPPGWKKKLAVGDKLPEEYETQAQSVPDEILKRLPETTEGTEILQVGDEVIRVMENTREIVDILGIGQGRVDDE